MKIQINKITIIISLAFITGIISIALFALWQDYIETKFLYNAQLITFENRNDIFIRKYIDSGYQKAILLAADWDKDPRLGKIQIINDVNFSKKKYRSAIRYVFQYEGSENSLKKNPCDREYHLKEVFTTTEGNKVLKNHNWSTKECYESGTSPEVLNGIIYMTNVESHYQQVIQTALQYLKQIFEQDSSLFIRNATYAFVNKGLPESWQLQIVNKCWFPDSSCPSLQIMMNLSEDGKEIWTVFISGTPKYVTKWKYLEYLNPNRPGLKDKKA